MRIRLPALLPSVVLLIVLCLFIAHEPARESDGTAARGSSMSAELPPVAEARVSRPTSDESGASSGVASPRRSSFEDPFAHFSDFARSVIEDVRAGRRFRLSLPDRDLDFLFRPQVVTTEDFRVSLGPDVTMPSSFAVFEGIQISNRDESEVAPVPVAMALVNDAVTMSFGVEGQEYHVEVDPEGGAGWAVPLRDYTRCEPGPRGTRRLICTDPVPTRDDFLPVGFSAMEEAGDDSVLMDLEEEKKGWIEHDGYAVGRQYHNSLRDVIVLKVVDKKVTTNDPNEWPRKAAAVLLNSSKAANVSERELGLRYLLMEIILIPDSAEYDDPTGNGREYTDADGNVRRYKNHGTGLEDFSVWIEQHRPKRTYQYGHAMCMMSPGGYIGYANDNGYGIPGRCTSLSELHGGMITMLHELGHNIGADHSVHGVMMPSKGTRNTSFLARKFSGGGAIMARQIYNFMSDPERKNVYGRASLRAPLEMPYANDDFVQTPENTPILIDVLANDDPAVKVWRNDENPGNYWEAEQEVAGAWNDRIKVIEVGSVYPDAAGTVEVVDDQVRFTPSPEFTGVVWLTYTILGDVGNTKSGWMHAADITIQVGDDPTQPRSRPDLHVRDDHFEDPLIELFHFNPLLNDIASGMNWGAPPEVILGTDGATRIDPTSAHARSYSFYLKEAWVEEGTGSLGIGGQHHVADGLPAGKTSGSLFYQPGEEELPIVRIRYIASDERGNEGTGLVTIVRTPELRVLPSRHNLYELGEGSTATVTFLRTAPADISLDLVVPFTLFSQLDWTASIPDLAMRGHASFDINTGAGTLVIPAGEAAAELELTAHYDAIAEAEEKLTLEVTDAGDLIPPLPLTLRIKDKRPLPLTETIDLWLPMNHTSAPDGKVRDVNGTVAAFMHGFEESAPSPWVPSVMGNALTFDGASTTLTLKESYSPPLGSSARTVTAWIRTSGNSSQTMEILTMGRTGFIVGIRGAALWFGVNAEGVLRLTLKSGVQAVGSTRVDDGKWHFVALVAEENAHLDEVRLYIDGIEDPTTVSGGKIQNRDWHYLRTFLEETDRVYIGARTPTILNGELTDPSRYFNGLIDEVRIFRRALSVEELVALYESAPLQPAMAWHQDFFGTEVVDWGANPDGDQLTLFEEYLFGGNPFAPDDHATRPKLVREGDAWVYSWNQRATGTHSFRYLVEASCDLIEWTEVTEGFFRSPHPLNPQDLEVGSVEVPHLPTADPAKFFRVRVELPSMAEE